MSTLLDAPPAEPASLETPHTAPAQRLRATMAAVRVSLRWLGVRKTLSRQQKEQAAESFGAEGDYLSAGKKLLDTSHPAFKAVTAVRHRILSYWKGITLPYPDPGIRLIRQEDIASFDVQLSTLQAELAEAVEELDRHYGPLRQTAAQRLGSLYNPADYPQTLEGLFSVEWDYPSVEPPSYLRQLSPQLYQEECRRIQARFEEAVRLSEEAFTEELAKLVTHLSERITGQEDGKPKIFRDSVVTRLGDFFERFRTLNVSSSDELDRLVSQCQRIVRGVAPQQLRDDQGLRQHIATQLSRVQSSLDQLLVERPRRNILRGSR